MENEIPLLTVVICCYSHQSFFKKTFDSVLQQRTKYPFKIVIFDNGSDVEYQTIINERAKAAGIEVFREHFNTYGLGFRIGLLHKIDTKYLALLHDDDIYLPEKVEQSLNVLERESLDFVITNTNFIDSNDEPHTEKLDEVNKRPLQSGETAGSLIADCFFTPGLRVHFSTLMVRTSIVQSFSLGDPFFPRIADAFFWKVLFTVPNIRFKIIEDRLTAVRIHAQNDRGYYKFKYRQRTSEFFKLSQSEIELFRSVLWSSDPKFISDFIRDFLTGSPDIDIVEGLIRVSIALSRDQFSISRTKMAALAFHKAFEIDGVRSSKLLYEVLGFDANKYMTDLYERYGRNVRIFSFGTNFRYLKAFAYLLESPSALLIKLRECFATAIVVVLKKLIPRNIYLKLRDQWRRLSSAKVRVLDEIFEGKMRLKF